MSVPKNLLGRAPRIAVNLTDYQLAALSAHWSAPELIPYARERAVWDPPLDVDFLFTQMSGWVAAPRERPAGWPGSLRWVQVAAVGVDAFPDWFFAAPVVTCGRGVQAVGIAEYVMGAILLHEKRFEEVRVRARRDWRNVPLGGIEGKTIGVAGMGAIGREIARKAFAFDARVGTVTRSGVSGDPRVETLPGLAELASVSDHLVLAMPLTRETRGIVGRAVLAAAKPGLHLVNVARGALIDDDALVEALDAGRLSGATLDVTDPEPLPEGHAFYGHDRIRLTPHVAGRSGGDDARLARKISDNLDRFLAGEPLDDVVDPARGY